MTCKDCLHFESCTTENMMSKSCCCEHIENGCNFFIDKELYIKLSSQRQKNLVLKMLAKPYFSHREEVERVLNEREEERVDKNQSPVCAYWIKQLDDSHYCSHCGREATYNYDGREIMGMACCYCGARMDGEHE